MLASVAAIVACLLMIGLVRKSLTVSRLNIFVALLLMHIAASVVYYEVSLHSPADSVGYYYDYANMGSQAWHLGTVFVTKVCQVVRFGLEASYFDCTLAFGSFGFAGLMILAHIFSDIQSKVGVPEKSSYLFLLFIPSVNYWTSAIGKDAPIFFAVSLCLWAVMSLRSRIVYFCVSLMIMVAFRAHIALMAVTALALGALFGSSISFGRKIVVAGVGAVGIAVIAIAVQSSIGVDATSASAMGDFFDKQSQVYSTVTGTTSLGNASYPEKVLSLLFRPLFFDAHGGLGIIASTENLGVIALFLYALVRWRDVAHLFRNVLFVRFILIFAFILLFLMSLLYYNVGLGLRQRVMAYPMIYCALVALWSLRQKRSLMKAAAYQPALMLDRKANRPVPEL